MNTLLELKSVCYTPYGDISRPNKINTKILSNISFKISSGTIAGVAGESGSGKTTLAKLIAGILKPTSGSILLNTVLDHGNYDNPVQILFQNNGEIINPYRKVFDAVKDFHEARHGKNSGNTIETKKIMDYVNIHQGLYNKKGLELSGGEQQRAAIAKVIASKPELMILDEPFSAQDPESRANLVELFRKINNDYKITMLCISHNLKLLKKLCGYIIIMYKGEIVEQGKCEEIFNSPSHPYTKYLLTADNYELSYDELKQIPVG